MPERLQLVLGNHCLPPIGMMNFCINRYYCLVLLFYFFLFCFVFLIYCSSSKFKSKQTLIYGENILILFVIKEENKPNQVKTFKKKRQKILQGPSLHGIFWNSKIYLKWSPWRKKNTIVLIATTTRSVNGICEVFCWIKSSLWNQTNCIQ